MPNAVAFRYARALADLAMKPGGVAGSAERDTVPGGAPGAQAGRSKASGSGSVDSGPGAAVCDGADRSPAGAAARGNSGSVRGGSGRAPGCGASGRGFRPGADRRPAPRALLDFSRATGKQARARFEVSENLIGGVVAKVGSTVFDGSVRGQLEALKQRMAGAGAQSDRRTWIVGGR